MVYPSSGSNSVHVLLHVLFQKEKKRKTERLNHILNVMSGLTLRQLALSGACNDELVLLP